TLWQGPDLESARLMARCFELQATGRPAAAALREAQLEGVQRRREKKAAAHPFFWAPYTLTGPQDAPPRQTDPSPSGREGRERLGGAGRRPGPGGGSWTMTPGPNGTKLAIKHRQIKNL